MQILGVLLSCITMVTGAVIHYPPDSPLGASYPDFARAAAQQSKIVYSNARFPCSASAGESLLCWSCEQARDGRECERTGAWQTCHGMSQCAVQYGRSATGAPWLSRGCSRTEDCHGEFHFQGAPPPCIIGNDNCRYCTYGTEKRDFQCLNVTNLQQHENRVFASSGSAGPCLPRSGAAGGLACFTCRDASDDTACLRDGAWEVCGQDEPVCEYKAVVSPSGARARVFRQCASRQDCPDAGDQTSSCNSTAKPGAVCRYCNYGVRKVEFDCVEPTVCNASAGESLMCRACHNVTDCADVTRWTACRHKHPACVSEERHDAATGAVLGSSRGCREDEDTEACDAEETCTTEGGVTMCRNCSSVVDGVNSKCAILRREEPCAVRSGQSLLCWTCWNVSSDTQCDVTGYWHACDQEQPVCGMSYSLTASGGRTRVSRGCRDRRQCPSVGAEQARCDGTKCSHCEFKELHKDHVCHDASILQAQPRVYSPESPCGNPDNDDVTGDDVTTSGDDVTTPRASAGRRLACWTCTNASSDAACLEEGEWEVCCQQEARCEYAVTTDAAGTVSSVTRRCRRHSDCEHHEVSSSDVVCDKMAASENCSYCSYGVDRLEFMCTDNRTSCAAAHPARLAPAVSGPHLQTATRLACPPPAGQPCLTLHIDNYKCFDDEECRQKDGARCCRDHCGSRCYSEDQLVAQTVCQPFGPSGPQFSQGDVFRAHGYQCVCDVQPDCQPCDATETDAHVQIADEDNDRLLSDDEYNRRPLKGSMVSVAEAVRARMRLADLPVRPFNSPPHHPERTDGGSGDGYPSVLQGVGSVVPVDGRRLVAGGYDAVKETLPEEVAQEGIMKDQAETVVENNAEDIVNRGYDGWKAAESGVEEKSQAAQRVPPAAAAGQALAEQLRQIAATEHAAQEKLRGARRGYQAPAARQFGIEAYQGPYDREGVEDYRGPHDTPQHSPPHHNEFGIPEAPDAPFVGQEGMRPARFGEQEELVSSEGGAAPMKQQQRADTQHAVSADDEDFEASFQQFMRMMMSRKAAAAGGGGHRP